MRCAAPVGGACESDVALLGREGEALFLGRVLRRGQQRRGGVLCVGVVSAGGGVAASVAVIVRSGSHERVRVGQKLLGRERAHHAVHLARHEGETHPISA
jgi:hypothetical protein